MRVLSCAAWKTIEIQWGVSSGFCVGVRQVLVNDIAKLAWDANECGSWRTLRRGQI